MRGTALVVLLCLFAALAAHVLSDQARARDLQSEEMYQPGEVDACTATSDATADRAATVEGDGPADAAAETPAATTRPADVTP